MGLTQKKMAQQVNNVLPELWLYHYQKGDKNIPTLVPLFYCGSLHISSEEVQD